MNILLGLLVFFIFIAAILAARSLPHTRPHNGERHRLVFHCCIWFIILAAVGSYHLWQYRQQCRRDALRRVVWQQYEDRLTFLGGYITDHYPTARLLVIRTVADDDPDLFPRERIRSALGRSLGPSARILDVREHKLTDFAVDGLPPTTHYTGVIRRSVSDYPEATVVLDLALEATMVDEFSEQRRAWKRPVYIVGAPTELEMAHLLVSEGLADMALAQVVRRPGLPDIVRAIDAENARPIDEQ